MNKEKKLEDAFEELDELIAKMEEDDLSLDDTFNLYTQGLNLVKFCNEKIEKIETEIKLVNEKTQLGQ